MNNNFTVIVGKWTGIFSILWYADVIHKHNNETYTSFSGLTKRGVMKKALRYVRRQLHPLEKGNSMIYTYNEENFTLEKVSV